MSSIWKDNYGFRVGWVMALIAGAVLVSILVMLFGVVRPLESRACDTKAEGLGIPESDFGLLTGCRVLVDGRWLPLDNVRFTEPTR